MPGAPPAQESDFTPNHTLKQSRNPSSIGNSQPTTPRWVAVALPLLTAVACFLGGATQRWSQAIALGGFALLLMVAPPRFSLRPILNIIAGIKKQIIENMKVQG